MAESFLLKGFLIGIIFGVPAGAIGALTIQRAFERGFIAGIVTGLGSSVAEIVYACIGIFGLTVISNFITNNQQTISVLGGFVILFISILLFRNKTSQIRTDTTKQKLFLYFASSFLIAILNPAIIISFFIALTSFEITGNLNLHEGLALIIGIFVGTLSWWFLLSGVVAIFRNRVKNQIFIWLNYILAAFLAIFGIAIIVRTLT